MIKIVMLVRALFCWLNSRPCQDASPMTLRELVFGSQRSVGDSTRLRFDRRVDPNQPANAPVLGWTRKSMVIAVSKSHIYVILRVNGHDKLFAMPFVQCFYSRSPYECNGN